MDHLSSTSARDRQNLSTGTSNDGSDDATDVESRGDNLTTSVINPDPSLFHKIKNQNSILTLLVSDSKIFAGTQGGDLLVWSLETFEFLANVHAHRGSVLCLSLSADRKFLFSGAGDAIVNVWCTNNLTRQYSIYSRYDVGDVFCVVYSTDLQTVYLGAQNTSIQVSPKSDPVRPIQLLISSSGMISPKKIPGLRPTLYRIRLTGTTVSLTPRDLPESLRLDLRHPQDQEPLEDKI